MRFNNIKNIEPRDENNERHGKWVMYWSDGKISREGKYVYGDKTGLWVINDYYGIMIRKIYYI